MKTVGKALALFLLMVLSPSGHAGQLPNELIKSAVSAVLASYETGKDKLDTDPSYLRGIIVEHILPHIDFVLMSKLVLGKHWRKATDAQRGEFTDGFRELLIRTYTKPLSEYSGQKVNFLPYHEGNKPKLATVYTEIVPHGGVPIPVSYRLRFKEQDGWKVFDMSIDNISLVTNYRSTFSGEIARSGLDKLIASLQ